MRMRFFVQVAACAALLAANAGAVSGQITVVVDERGKRVFVNAETPVQQPAARAARLVAGSSSSGPSTTASSQRVVTSREEIEQIVQEAAQRHHVDPALVRAVIKAESNWNPQAVSPKGAQGLMQLMPATADQHGVGDAFDPRENVNAGVKHLRTLLEKYNGDLDLALAAYNAGEGAVRRAGGVPNYTETRNYVQKVTEAYFQPGSGRTPRTVATSRKIYRIVDERGRVIYVNE
ncbi:MAG TPA: lytic transglycosylase domain-containing protein [Candidatus Nitrosotenuis sp.]|nr:lytic transglycosylase domain-containing protein [Candidatus Nitrosotenuis sp.]